MSAVLASKFVFSYGAGEPEGLLTNVDARYLSSVEVSTSVPFLCEVCGRIYCGMVFFRGGRVISACRLILGSLCSQIAHL